MDATDIYICNLEEEMVNGGLESRLHVYQGPYSTRIDAKTALKEIRTELTFPVIIKIVGEYRNFCQGNEMFSDKNGSPLPDYKEMKMH